MTGKLLYFYWALIAGALAMAIRALYLPPVHDGAWLIAVLMVLAAIALAALSNWLGDGVEPSTTTEKDTTE